METRPKIRLALISQSMRIGGAEMMAARLAGYLDHKTFEIKLFILHDELNNQIRKHLEDNRVCYECLHLQNLSMRKAYRRFSEALSLFRPDIVHENQDKIYSWIWTFINKIPLVFTQHSDPYRRSKKRLLTSLLIRLRGRGENVMIVGCSEKTRELTIQRYHLNPDRVVCIYNPIDTHQYFHADREDNHIRFIYVARFMRSKKHELLVDAFNELAKRYENISLYLAGDGTLFGNIQSLVGRLGLEGRVHMPGNVENIPQLLSGMSVFVMPSESEACPLSILEAMASGLPVVASRVGGIPELVQGNGLLTELDNRQSLIDAMETVIRNSELRKTFSEESIRRASLFDQSRIAAQYQDLYISMTEKNSRQNMSGNRK